MKLAFLGLCAVLSAGCSSSDSDQQVLVDISGPWAGSVKNESNSCPGAFNVGETSAIQLTITQDTSRVSIKLEGVVGLLLNVGFGTDTFTGSITSDKIEATLLGRNEVTEGTCKFKWTATLSGDVRDGKMVGKVTYKPNPQSGDCSAISSCSRVQSFDVDQGKVVSDAGTTG